MRGGGRREAGAGGGGCRQALRGGRLLVFSRNKKYSYSPVICLGAKCHYGHDPLLVLDASASIL